MTQQIILGWRAMQVVYCPLRCQGWTLRGPFSGRHVAGRIAPPAACLGQTWATKATPGLPPEHLRPWWENAPQEIVAEEGRSPVAPEPHSRAWDYLPPAPAVGCTCGYHLAFKRDRAAMAVARFCGALLLYCQGLGRGVVHRSGARVEAFRILAWLPPWCAQRGLCQVMAPEAMAWARRTLGPELLDSTVLPTGVFDHLPPEVAALLEGVTR